jgi:hypothetical protein
MTQAQGYAGSEASTRDEQPREPACLQHRSSSIGLEGWHRDREKREYRHRDRERVSVRLIEVKSLVSLLSGSLPGRHALGQLLFMELLEIVRQVSHLLCHALEVPGMHSEAACTTPDLRFGPPEAFVVTSIMDNGRG